MLKPALWSPLEPAWDSEVTPLLDPKVILGVATGQRQVPPGDHLMTSQRSRCPGNEIVCRTGASSNRFCPVSFRRVLLAPTSCRAQNAPCFSFLERLLFWFSADRRGEAPAGCRRVYSPRFTHEFPRRANCKVLVSSDCGKEQTNALLKGLVETWNTTEYDFFVREASTMPEPPHIRVFADGPGNELCQGYKWLFEHGRNPELVDWETEDGAGH